MRVAYVVVAAVVLGTALPIWLHVSAHSQLNVHQAGLSFFLWLNVIIALWELCLLGKISLIEQQYAGFKEPYRGRELARVFDFFGKRISFAQIFYPSTWAEVWSSYALFDESYANRKSYGFFIDVGNGLSTLLPSLLCLYGMTFELVSARVLGVVLLILNYQMWYGTIVYFGSYLFNRRYKGHRPRDVAVFVGLSNGIWFTFPLWAMWAGLTMIWSDSYLIFR